MELFHEALRKTLNNEGGYSNNKNDKGGETYRGISRKYNKNWIGWATIDDYKKANLPKLEFEDALNSDFILQESVKNFYLDNYWDKYKLGQIENPNVADFLFDFVVNSGQAIKVVQRALGLEDDGIVGPKTIKAINETKDALQTLVNARVEYLKGLKGFDTFGRGWVARANSYLV